jgi:CO dehydrogenase/acetyl-CoA synthase epsilon subunit
MKIKTVKSLIKILDEISKVDRDELKGIKSEEQYDLIGVVRSSIQNELSELKELSK